MLYKTQGIIIKNSNLGEFDRLITAYTQDFGKLIIKGKAVRKNQAKLKGHLELFLCSHLMIAPGRGFDVITGAETIEKFSHLGAGFKIAMKDLEIRGAGNLLGLEQSGYIQQVGFDLYCHMLKEAIRQYRRLPKGK